VEKYGRARQATDDSTAHALCMPDDQGYRQTHVTFKWFLLFHGKMDSPTHLSVTLYVHCLSRYEVAQ